MIRNFAAIALILASPAFAQAPAVEGAWLRLPAATGRPAAGYLSISGGATADALVSAASPKAERIELHSMTMTDGVMRMRAETSIAIPAGTVISFAPGGHHLMLFGLSPDVLPGQTVPLTLSFKSGAKITTSATARSPADDPAKASGHAHH